MQEQEKIKLNTLIVSSSDIKTPAVIATAICFLLASNAFDSNPTVVAVCTLLGVLMVLSQKVEFFPALTFLFATGNSSSLLTPLVMIMICVYRFKELRKDKNIGFLFILLILVLPLFVILVYQRLTYDYEILAKALSYAQYYLTFWCFLYFYLIGKSLNCFTIKLLLGAFIIHVIFATLFHVDFVAVHGRIYIFALSIICTYFFLKILEKNNRQFYITLFLIALFFFSKGEMTFTKLGSFVFAIGVVFLVNRRKSKILSFIGQYPIFIIWFIVILYGINNYYEVEYNHNSEGVSLTSWSSFKQYLNFKIFSDRAPFWDGAVSQLTLLRPYFPIHDIPDISFETYNRSGEVDFGAHNTYLQLLRIYGFIMGGILIYCYIQMTSLGTKSIMVIRQPLFVSIVAVAIAFSVVFCLTGTAVMLTNTGLLVFGVLGLAYRQCNI